MYRVPTITLLVFCFGLILAIQACSSKQKNLTAESAKSMLEESLRTKGDAYPVDVAFVAGQIRSKTREDYSEGSYDANDPRNKVQKLLRTGYITQWNEPLTYRNVSGTYKFGNESTTDKRLASFILTMRPGHVDVEGEYTLDDWWHGQHTVASRGPVRGEVAQDGTVTLLYGQTPNPTIYQFSVEGNVLKLVGPETWGPGQRQCTFVGAGPGGVVTVPWYSYTFSDKVKGLLDPARNSIRGGKVEIDAVRGLLLATETRATAKFTWHVHLNEAAKILVGKDTVVAEGDVIFGKQPDGAWVLTEYERPE